MRNLLKAACSTALASLAGMTAMAVAIGGVDMALAQNVKAKRTSAGFGAPAEFASDHQSILRLSERDGFPLHRGIKLGRNKSMLVEISRDLRDVIVSNPELMDAVVQSANRVYLIGKKTGQSNVFLFDSNGDQIATFEVVVEHDAAPLEALFQRLIPASRIKIEILNETVILTGSVRNPADSARASDIASRFIVGAPESDNRSKQKVINLLQIEAEEQVMLRVTVAEVERSVLKQMGVNLGAAVNSGNFATSLLTENALPLTAAAGLGKLPIPGVNLQAAEGATCAAGATCLFNSGPGANTFGNSGFDVIGRANGQTLAGTLRMLERHGLVRTLAEPNLTAVSGETAKFLAGGEFPIPMSVNNGQLSVSFKEFGVGVAFTPMVLSEGRINLKIETEVSEISSVGSITLSGFQLPALKKRQAKSTVELPSGGTLAMAGLLSDDTRKNIDGLPGLKDLPVLGTLFRSQDYIKRETELVVLVTPYVVRPTALKKFARPTDGLAAASDLKSNFLGHMNRVYGRRANTVIEQGLKDGDLGFIVE